MPTTLLDVGPDVMLHVLWPYLTLREAYTLYGCTHPTWRTAMDHVSGRLSRCPAFVGGWIDAQFLHPSDGVRSLVQLLAACHQSGGKDDAARAHIGALSLLEVCQEITWVGGPFPYKPKATELRDRHALYDGPLSMTLQRMRATMGEGAHWPIGALWPMDRAATPCGSWLAGLVKTQHRSGGPRGDCLDCRHKKPGLAYLPTLSPYDEPCVCRLHQMLNCCGGYGGPRWLLAVLQDASKPHWHAFVRAHWVEFVLPCMGRAPGLLQLLEDGRETWTEAPVTQRAQEQGLTTLLRVWKEQAWRTHRLVRNEVLPVWVRPWAHDWLLRQPLDTVLDAVLTPLANTTCLCTDRQCVAIMGPVLMGVLLRPEEGGRRLVPIDLPWVWQRRALMYVQWWYGQQHRRTRCFHATQEHRALSLPSPDRTLGVAVLLHSLRGTVALASFWAQCPKAMAPLMRELLAPLPMSRPALMALLALVVLRFARDTGLPPLREDDAALPLDDGERLAQLVQVGRATARKLRVAMRTPRSESKDAHPRKRRRRIGGA